MCTVHGEFQLFLRIILHVFLSGNKSLFQHRLAFSSHTPPVITDLFRQQLALIDIYFTSPPVITHSFQCQLALTFLFTLYMLINTILQHKTKERTRLFMSDIIDENSLGPVLVQIASECRAV